MSINETPSEDFIKYVKEFYYTNDPAGIDLIKIADNFMFNILNKDLNALLSFNKLFYEKFKIKKEQDMKYITAGIIACLSSIINEGGDVTPLNNINYKNLTTEDLKILCFPSTLHKKHIKETIYALLLRTYNNGGILPVNFLEILVVEYSNQEIANFLHIIGFIGRVSVSTIDEKGFKVLFSRVKTFKKPMRLFGGPHKQLINTVMNKYLKNHYKKHFIETLLSPQAINYLIDNKQTHYYAFNAFNTDAIVKHYLELGFYSIFNPIIVEELLNIFEVSRSNSVIDLNARLKIDL